MAHRDRLPAAAHPQYLRLLALLFLSPLLASCGGDSGDSPTAPSEPKPAPLSSAHQLLSFSFLGASNPGLSADAQGALDGSDVLVNVSRSVNASSLAATFTVSDGAKLTIGGVAQVSGSTRNDFTSVVDATVVAEDGSPGEYSVFLGRLLEAGEVIGWQRSAGQFRYLSDPADIRSIDVMAPHMDSVFPLIVDTLHAHMTDTIVVDVFPSKAAFDDHLRTIGVDPKDWYTGISLGNEILMISPDCPGCGDTTLDDLISTMDHEVTHSVIFSFGNIVPIWLHEGLASLATAPEGLLAACFPGCSVDYSFQRWVVESAGKPDLETMFTSDPAVGYAFAITIPPFIVQRYGWDALRSFLAAPWDYSAFGLQDSHAFERAWYAYLDEAVGATGEGVPAVISLAEAQTVFDRRVAVEGTVTWQPSWNHGIYFIQDSTAGIRVFQAYDAVELVEGDRVRLQGVTLAYQGALELTEVPSVTVLEHGTVPDPRSVTGAQVNDGQFQGELAEIAGAVEAIVTLEYGNQQVTVRDDSGTAVTVFAAARTGVVPADWPAVGTRVRVRGVLGASDAIGPRVEVRRSEDVTVMS